MSNNYKGSPLFNQIGDVKLRTWNRCAIIFNLYADRGEQAAKAYASQFNEDDKLRINNMFALIKQYGYEAIRKQCTPAKLEA